MTDPQADLLERARALVERWEHGSEEHRQWLRDMCVPDVAAFAQSEREAAEERLEIETGEAYERGVQSGMKLCEAAAADLREALQDIIIECDPADPEWTNPAEGRRNCYEIARAALASPPAPQEPK